VTSRGCEEDGLVEHGPDVLVAIDLAHGDLAGGDEAVEQDDGGVLGGKRALGLHPTAKLLIEALDGVGGAQASPLLRRESVEGQQLVAALGEAGDDAGAGLLGV